MKIYIYQIFSKDNLELAAEELEKLGLQNSFVIEEENRVLIGGSSANELATEHGKLVEIKEMRVDWEEQWRAFSKNFSQGLCQLDIEGKPLFLAPGEGFGDCSHPTTNVMLKMMKPYVKNGSIIDIGSGSGVLTLASILLGAKKAHGVEIDEKAILHAKKNQKLNGIKTTFSKNLPLKLEPSIFLMNMILPDQRAFEPSRFNSYAEYWITSGILESEREKYRDQTQLWGWNLVSEHRENGWLGFVFTT